MRRIRLEKPETLNQMIVDKDMVFAYQHGEVYRNIYDTGMQWGFKMAEDILLANDLNMFCHFLPETEILRWINSLPKVKIFIRDSLVTL